MALFFIFFPRAVFNVPGLKKSHQTEARLRREAGLLVAALRRTKLLVQSQPWEHIITGQHHSGLEGSNFYLVLNTQYQHHQQMLHCGLF
jgi:hypothetical protein